MDLLKKGNKGPRTGARVYGLPISLDLASYIDDVSSTAEYERFFSMYFAGKQVNISTSGFNDVFFEEDF